MKKRVLLLGSGELGLGIALALKRCGATVVACDSYHGAPAMRVADISVVTDMTDDAALRTVVADASPDVIIPEVEAIAVDVLYEAENAGVSVVPSARAVATAMHRGRLRALVRGMGVRTSQFAFADSELQVVRAVEAVGLPCVVKPMMSSSGRGMVVVRTANEVVTAYRRAIAEGRTCSPQVIVEQFVDFDAEFTLLTVRTSDGVLFCEPVAHVQEHGDYRYSWQPAQLSASVVAEARAIAERVTAELGGYGVFGVEFFVKGDVLFFNEVAPRPHDTGMVTMVTQNVDEFELHARIALDLPVGNVELQRRGCSAAIIAYGDGDKVEYEGIDAAETIPGVRVELFGKPGVHGHRRMGVVLAPDVETARRACSLIAVKVS